MKNQITQNEADVVAYKPDENAVWRQQFEEKMQELNDQKRALEARVDPVEAFDDVIPYREKSKNAQKLIDVEVKILNEKGDHEMRQAVEYRPFIEQNSRQLNIAELRLKVLENDKVAKSGIDAEALNERRAELKNAIDKYSDAISIMEGKVEEHMDNAQRMYDDADRIGYKEREINAIRLQKDNVEHGLRRTDELIKQCEEKEKYFDYLMPKLEKNRALQECELHKVPDTDVEKRSIIMGKIEKLEASYADIAGQKRENKHEMSTLWEKKVKDRQSLRKLKLRIEHHEDAEQAVGNTFGNIADMLADAGFVTDNKVHGSSLNAVARGTKEYVSQAISEIGEKLETIKDSLEELADKVKDVISK